MEIGGNSDLNVSWIKNPIKRETATIEVRRNCKSRYKLTLNDKMDLEQDCEQLRGGGYCRDQQDTKVSQDAEIEVINTYKSRLTMCKCRPSRLSLDPNKRCW
jgi:hypothetical protein